MHHAFICIQNKGRRCCSQEAYSLAEEEVYTFKTQTESVHQKKPNKSMTHSPKRNTRTMDDFFSEALNNVEQLKV